METNPEKIRAWFAGYQAGKRRAVLIDDEINSSTLSKWIGEIVGLEKEKKEDSSLADKPILLLLSTPGGDIDATYNFQDFINSLESPVDGLVLTKASSMGVDLLQMCRRRTMLPNSNLFCHFTRCGFKFIIRGTSVSERDIRDLMRRAKSNHEGRVALYRERTGMTSQQIFELFRRGEDNGEKITAKEALKLGLIDGIDHGFKLF